MTDTRNPRPGDRVRIERDETRYPSKGTWPQFRGRVGTIVEINLDEYGVVFGKVTPRTDGRGKFSHGDIVTWFKRHEIAREAATVAAEGANSRPEG
jgi:hypothetical protein